MQHLDTNGDKEISASEASSKPDIFLKSQVTFFGQLYDLKNLRDEVFLVKMRWGSFERLTLRFILIVKKLLEVFSLVDMPIWWLI